MKHRIKVLLLLFVLAALHIKGGQPDPADKLKAVYIYNFTKFIEWPSNSFSSPSSPFVIGVYGNNNLTTYLEEAVLTERVLGHPITVKVVQTKTDIEKCHILYIGETTDANEMNFLITAISKDILTVGDGRNFNRNGGLIRFYNDENKIRFSINYDLLKASRLSVSSKLLSLATIYTEK